MTCKYCDFKEPKPGTPYRAGTTPVGKPLTKRRDEYYIDFIILCHEDGRRCNPPLDIDRYLISWDRGGTGYFAEINFCPICGRDLRGGE